MNGLEQYRSQQVQTASKEEIVVLLYDGTRRFVDRAAVALAAGKYEEVGRDVGRAQQILGELLAALDMSVGEIPANLAQLYDYWIRRLTHGLVHKDAAAFEEVSAALFDLRGAWAEAAKQVRAQRGVSAVG